MNRNEATTVKLFAFTRTNNQPKTGDAANISVLFSLDNGTPTAMAGTVEEIRDGFYRVPVAAAENNGTTVDFFPTSATANVVVICVEHVRDIVQPDVAELLAAVNALAVLANDIKAKTQLITAGKIRVSSRVIGNTITAKIGDDHLIAAEHALWLEVDDEDNAIFQLLTDNTVTAITFGAGRDNRRDEITAAVTADDVQHVGTKTRIPIELASADTAGKRADSYDFDIQVTTAAGHKVTKPQLEGLLILSADRAE